MKILIDTIIFTFLLILICFTHCSQEKRNIIDYCPQAGEVEGWQPDGKAEIARGEDLFLLINGGAEIYYEYGFKQTIYQTYRGEHGKSINLEIYEMKNPESAYGIYTFKTSKVGKRIGVGQDGWLETYYLNFWKGNFLVTLIGFDSEPETLDGLMEMAKSVDAKIKVPGQRPKLVSYLPAENLTENGMTYIRGNLGLLNQYEFDAKNIFGVTECIIGDYGDYSVFILRYKDQEESVKWYESAREHLKKSSQFSDSFTQDQMFYMTDNRGNKLIFKPYRNMILIKSGANHIMANHLFDLLEVNIDQHSR
jgi:hypothetical protein